MQYPYSDPLWLSQKCAIWVHKYLYKHLMYILKFPLRLECKVHINNSKNLQGTISRNSRIETITVINNNIPKTFIILIILIHSLPGTVLRFMYIFNHFSYPLRIRVLFSITYRKNIRRLTVQIMFKQKNRDSNAESVQKFLVLICSTDLLHTICCCTVQYQNKKLHNICLTTPPYFKSRRTSAFSQKSRDVYFMYHEFIFFIDTYNLSTDCIYVVQNGIATSACLKYVKI